MTPEFIERARKDFENEEVQYLDWESYLRGYWAATKRFGGRGRNIRREIKPKLGYSRVGLNNV